MIVLPFFPLVFHLLCFIVMAILSCTTVKVDPESFTFILLFCVCLLYLRGRDIACI
jgi:hypothetical protein